MMEVHFPEGEGFDYFYPPSILKAHLPVVLLLNDDVAAPPRLAPIGGNSLGAPFKLTIVLFRMDIE